MPRNIPIQLRRGTSTEWSNENPVLSSGEPGFDTTNNIVKVGDGVNNWTNLSATVSSNIETYVKNNTGNTLTKGQVVYINGSQGDHPTIGLSMGDAESTSSKTLGLLRQTLAHNEFGYVVSEGILEGIDTSAANTAGETIWLSPTIAGGVVYGTANKPSAPNHLVFLGYVLRKQLNNGKIYIKIQNGFELQELHNVAVSGVTDGQFLQYNTDSGLWLPSSSGNFTTLQVNGTGVSINGHIHTTRSVSAGVSNGTLTPSIDTTDLYVAEGLTGAITFAAPSGTPSNGQKLLIRTKDNGSARGITWTTSSGGYRAIGITLPTTTVPNKTTYVGCIYNSADTFWDAIATVTQS